MLMEAKNSSVSKLLAHRQLNKISYQRFVDRRNDKVLFDNLERLIAVKATKAFNPVPELSFRELFPFVSQVHLSDFAVRIMEQNSF